MGEIYIGHVYTVPDTTLTGTWNPQLETDQKTNYAGGGPVPTCSIPPSWCADVSGKQANRQLGFPYSSVDCDAG